MDRLRLYVDVVFFTILFVVIVIWVCSGIVYFREAVVTALRRKVMDKRLRSAALGGMVSDTYTKESSREEVGGGCAICLCEYEDGEQRITIAACNHRFHAACIEAWFKKMYTCPLCRHNLV